MKIFFAVFLFFLGCGQMDDQSVQQLTDSSTDTSKGPKGDTGPMGPIGPQGPKGDKGDQGDEGLQGEQGVQGEQGDQGLQGVAGADGAVGATGATGETGSQGVQGIQGVAGANGSDYKVYNSGGTAIAYYVGYTDMSTTAGQPVVDVPDSGVSLMIVRSLTANEYTAYVVGTYTKGSVAAYYNTGSYGPNPQALKLKMADGTDYGSETDYYVYYSGASCTGTAHLRIDNGGTAYQMNSAYLTILGFPNMWLRDGTGTYEVKLTGTYGASLSAQSYRGPSGCQNIAATPTGVYYQVTVRAAAFASGFGLNYYIDR